MVQAAVIECLVRMSEPELAAALEESPSGALLAWRAAADVDGPAADAAPESAAEAAPESAAEAAPKFAAESASEVASTPDAGADAAPVVRAALDAPPAGPRTAAPSEAATARRIFGRSGVTASPLVISGAFDLSPGSLHVAAEAGVDLFFWEETYAAMTRFLRARRQHTRAQVVTGSYHADGPSITRDVERALRRLRRETLDVFLLFWARSSARLDEDAFAALARLRQAGKVRAVGFSTHDRALASDALARAPWDVVMTRHSAAHPGIEAELLPQAQAAGAGILTFSALCYGRMVAGAGAPSAADCYRYSLSQPGVTACISAPRRHRELVENLEVLARPVLDEPALAALRAHGQGVRIENQRFGSLIRQPTRDAAAAAMAMLESTLPPVAGEPAGPAAPGVPGVPGEPSVSSVSSVSSFRAARRRGSLAQPGTSSRLRRGRL